MRVVGARLGVSPIAMVGWERELGVSEVINNGGDWEE